jgi:hypothetical protein
MSYDKKCYDLAEHFLQDVADVMPGEAQDLAESIQAAVENWIEETKSRRAFRPTCIHAKAGICLDCYRERDYDPESWDEYGHHPEGEARTQALLEQIAADVAREEATPRPAPDPNIPF